MKRLVVVLLVVALAVAVLCLGATESLINRSGKTASGVVVTFSEPVRITSYDQAVFPSQEPTGRAKMLTFSGGVLANGGRFRVSWTPSSAEVTGMQWVAAPVEAAEAPSDLPMGFETTSDAPTVTGDPLNPLYFAHGAYVIQGVDDPAKAFALPLLGVPELSFFPTTSGIDPSTVTWKIEVSHPEGISAEIRGNVLYIWGSSATWAGYGAVTLTGTAGNASGSVTIPVTVFRTDKTLVNAEGKKDYFVPWSPQLDINRVLSVEEHMRKYAKADDGLLDRTIRFSAWDKMRYVKGGRIIGWVNETRGAPEPYVLARVDEAYRELRQIGCDGVEFWRNYYMESPSAACPTEVFDRWTPGLSMTDEEVLYAINEAHLQGLRILWTPDVAETLGALRVFSTPDIEGWFNCYSDIVAKNARIAQSAGADYLTVVNNLLPEAFPWPYRGASAWNTKMQSILREDVRPVYAGPVAHMPGGIYLSHGNMDLVPFDEQVDIVGGNNLFPHLVRSTDPTLEEVRDALRDNVIEAYVVPLQERLDKPMFTAEGFTNSYDGFLALLDCSEGYSCGMPANAVYDGGEQATWYRAWFEVEKEFPFLFGLGWGFWPLRLGLGGVGDPGGSPRLKPAEREIARAYGAADPFATVWVDGDPTDWTDASFKLQDPPNDASSTGPDLVSIAVKQDDAYTYLGIWLSAGVPPTGGFRILIDTNGDANADVPIWVSSFSLAPWWIVTMYESVAKWGVVRGLLDINSNDANTFFELRIPRALLKEDVRPLGFKVVLEDRTGNPRTLDETSWLAVRAQGGSVLETLDCGVLTDDLALVFEGARSMLGEYQGSRSFTPYLRTAPGLLPLTPQGHYRVCFDYRIVETSEDGFEVLFYSPAGAKKNDWVSPLRLHGPNGQSGHACLEGQLLDYPDFEIRWNVISTGRIVIDNVVTTDLSTGQVVAKEDFEGWK